MSEFEQEIETIKKGCGKICSNNDCVTSCRKEILCPSCQIKLETAQRLKIIHDNEISRIAKVNSNYSVGFKDGKSEAIQEVEKCLHWNDDYKVWYLTVADKSRLKEGGK